tara:strand:+ start:376 stop:4236 length:3861 start_codon:yes stop_codon:yes gene_type:complete
MPKEVWKIDKFEGGLNSHTDPKDIKSKELVEAQDVNVSKVGQLKNLGKPTTNTSVPSKNIEDSSRAGIISGRGLYRMVNDYSLGPPQDLNSAATVSVTNTSATEGTKASATFIVQSLFYVFDNHHGETDNAGTLSFQLKGDTTNLHTSSFTVLDIDGTPNEFNNETIESMGSSFTSQNSARTWYIPRGQVSKYGVSNQEVLGNGSYSAYGFHRHINTDGHSVILPRRQEQVGLVTSENLEYILRRESFCKKLVAVINADGSAVVDAVYDGNGKITITASAVGTTLNGKQIKGTCSNASLTDAGSTTDIPVPSTDEFLTLKAANGVFIISGDTELSGGTGSISDVWTITLDGNDANGDRVHVSIFMNSGSGQQGPVTGSPFIFSGTKAELATTIASAINAISGVSASAGGASGNIVTITAGSAGIANGFTVEAYALNENEPIFDYSSEDEQLYLVNKIASTSSSNSNHDLDIYRQSVIDNYTLNHTGWSCAFDIFSSNTGTWHRAGDGDIFNDCQYLPIASQYGNYVWRYANFPSQKPNPISFHNGNITRFIDANFNLPNYNHFIGHIDNSKFFPNYKAHDGTEMISGYANLYSSINKWWLYHTNKNWAFSQYSNLTPKYGWDDNTIMGLAKRGDSGPQMCLMYSQSYQGQVNNELLHGDNAGMLINFWTSGSNQSPDSNWSGKIRLYAAAIYNDGSESLPSHQFEFGYGDTKEREFEFDSPSAEDGSSRFPLIAVHLRAMQNAVEDNNDATGNDFCFADPRVTGIRLYYTHSDESYSLYWSLGAIDFRQGWVFEDGGTGLLSEDGDDANENAYLLHPKIADYKWTSINSQLEYDSEGNAPFDDSNMETPNHLDPGDSIWYHGTMKLFAAAADSEYAAHNVMPGLTMPKVRTYEMINGYDPLETTTLACRYKAATLAGQRLFVGNIEVEENGVKKYYNDRVIFSPVGKLDTLPYPTNVLDVDISDGDEIIALASTGGKLLQWKRRTLYVVDIQSGMPDTFFVSDRFKNRGLIDRNHFCDITDGVFWFNEFGAWVYDGEEIKDVFSVEDDDIKQQRIDATEWSDFVSSSSMCEFNPHSREVIIVKKNEQSSTVSDGDCYVYNIDVDSWSFGSGRMHLGHSSGTKELTNMGNIGTLYQAGYFAENADNTLVANLKTWEYKNQSTDNFKIVTKITDLGSPEAKKSILGLVVNTTQKTAASTYNISVSWRDGVDKSWEDLTSISRAYDSTVGQNTNQGLQHRIMFQPPAVKGITDLQLKFEGNIQGDFGINDISLIFRKYRTSSVNTFTDE